MFEFPWSKKKRLAKEAEDARVIFDEALEKSKQNYADQLKGN